MNFIKHIFLNRPFYIFFFILIFTFSLYANVSNETPAAEKKFQQALSYFKEKKYESVKKLLLPSISKHNNNLLWQETLYEAMILNLKSKAYCKKAGIALKKKNYTEAKSYFKECKRLSPFASHLSLLNKRIINLEKEKSSHKMKKEILKKIQKWKNEAQKKEKDSKWEKALVFWNKILILNPENKQARKHKTKCILEISNKIKKKEAKVILKKALINYKQKKYLEAKFLFKQYLQSFSKDKKALLYLKKINKELQIISEKAQMQTMAKSLYVSALILKKEENFKKALELLYEGKGLAPKQRNWDKEIFIVKELKFNKFKKSRQHKIEIMNQESRKGVATLLGEKLELAVNHLSLALKIAKELNSKSDIEYNEKYLKTAKEGLERKNKEQVNENNPFYPLVQKLFQFGDKKYKLGKYKEAYNAYEKVRNLFPENRLAIQKIILCNLQLHPETAENQIKTIVEYGKDLMKKKDYRAAKSNFLVVKQIKPTYPEIDKLLTKTENFLKGRILQKKISKAKADSIYNKALHSYKKNPVLALKKLNHLLRLYPNHNNALNLKNRLQHILLGNPKTNQDKTISPKAVLLFTRGLRFYTNGDLLSAKKAFEKSIKISPNYNKARRALKRVKRQLKG